MEKKGKGLKFCFVRFIILIGVSGTALSGSDNTVVAVPDWGWGEILTAPSLRFQLA